MEKHTKSKKTKGNVAIMRNLRKHQKYILKHVKIIENNGNQEPNGILMTRADLIKNWTGF